MMPMLMRRTGSAILAFFFVFSLLVPAGSAGDFNSMMNPNPQSSPVPEAAAEEEKIETPLPPQAETASHDPMASFMDSSPISTFTPSPEPQVIPMDQTPETLAVPSPAPPVSSVMPETQTYEMPMMYETMTMPETQTYEMPMMYEMMTMPETQTYEMPMMYETITMPEMQTYEMPIMIEPTMTYEMLYMLPVEPVTVPEIPVLMTSPLIPETPIEPLGTSYEDMMFQAALSELMAYLEINGYLEQMWAMEEEMMDNAYGDEIPLTAEDFEDDLDYSYSEFDSFYASYEDETEMDAAEGAANMENPEEPQEVFAAVDGAPVPKGPDAAELRRLGIQRMNELMLLTQGQNQNLQNLTAKINGELDKLSKQVQAIDEFLEDTRLAKIFGNPAMLAGLRDGQAATIAKFNTWTASLRKQKAEIEAQQTSLNNIEQGISAQMQGNDKIIEDIKFYRGQIAEGEVVRGRDINQIVKEAEAEYKRSKNNYMLYNTLFNGGQVKGVNTGKDQIHNGEIVIKRDTRGELRAYFKIGTVYYPAEKDPVTGLYKISGHYSDAYRTYRGAYSMAVSARNNAQTNLARLTGLLNSVSRILKIKP